MRKDFSIYRSSAGSGKTRTLAKAYLKMALKYRSEYFKHILAVTFTNKATQEMKSRIINYLYDFAHSKPHELANELKEELDLDDLSFQERCQEILSEILHHYTSFSISTIDAFFQRVIRSFTREAELHGDYRLEVDANTILEEVVNGLIDELGEDPHLTSWVVAFAQENLVNDGPWDIRKSLVSFSKEIFSESFKTIEDEFFETTTKPGFFKDLIQKLKAQKWSFIKGITERAQVAIKHFQDAGLTPDDFKYKKSGVYGYFLKISGFTAVADFEEKGKRAEGEFLDPANWPAKDSDKKDVVLQLAQEVVLPLFNALLEFRDTHFQKALSCEIALNNFYALGLIADISRKLREYNAENNVMLLADAPKFLHGVIQNSDTPFIYEKVGSFYNNYLIDEFQDTSGYQWKNFLPLLNNSLDQGYPCLLVGDVKQAIYRWRGGDLSLLQNGVEAQLGKERVGLFELDTNYRSLSHIVDFNNEIFLQTVKFQDSVKDAYHDVAQKGYQQDNGFVCVEFLSGDEEGWKDQALDRVPHWMEKLQQAGIPLSEMAILVRSNFEGHQIVNYLLRYKDSERAKPDCRYDVISNESLRLDGASGINLLLGALGYLVNPYDGVSRALLAYEHARNGKRAVKLGDVFMVSNQVTFESQLPPAFSKDKSRLRKLPLYELIETLIGIFELGSASGELAYLLAFQDLVLEFSNHEKNDISAFLDWWELNKETQSLQISGDINAAQIFTIHKSKGLQFPYVLIPFCSWSLDHDGRKSPNLWVKSDQDPFRDAGYLPVRYSKKLTSTFFEQHYTQEKEKAILDNVNILYVALTRAEKGLVIQAPDQTVGKTRGTVSDMLLEAITQSAKLNDFYDPITGVMQLGELSYRPSAKEAGVTVSLSSYPTYEWRDKLVIRRLAKEYFGLEDNTKRKQINQGIHMHTILSRIKYASEMDASIEGMIREGLISQQEKGDLKDQLHKLFEDPQIKEWFAEKWDVQTEVPILVPGAPESRIDRLLTHYKDAIVIDFKTGAYKKADQLQVEHYMRVLKEMNFRHVEGFLLYLEGQRVITVTHREMKVVSQPQQSQLNLGF